MSTLFYYMVFICNLLIIISFILITKNIIQHFAILNRLERDVKALYDIFIDSLYTITANQIKLQCVVMFSFLNYS